MVTDPFLVGVFFGFVPAMGFLYLLLRDYQSFFGEKRLFRIFFVGLIVGILATVAEQFLSPAVLGLLGSKVTDAATVSLLGVYAALLGLLEAMIFTAVLNWKTFQKRRDTPFYGLAFGLGFGGTNVLFLVITILQKRGTNQVLGLTDWTDLFLILLLGLYFVGSILIHASMGAWIGRGTGLGPLVPSVIQSAALRAVYVALLYGLLLVEPPILSHSLAVAGVALGVTMVLRVRRTVLDRVVPPEILREMDIHNRRVARQVLRDEDEPERPAT